tara:strand:+ start:3402 stop:4046 length:645 start_codon:yes stop_codon:yes gene_type:complete
MRIECFVKSINFEKFSEIFKDDSDDDKIKFGQDSYVIVEIEKKKDDDDRDTEIKKLLSNDYKIQLDPCDINLFVDLVENKKCIICDLNDDRNQKVFQYAQEIKENDKYTESYILDNLDKDYKFLKISTLSKLPHKLFQDYPDKFNWDRISYLNLPMNFLDENCDNINWSLIDYEELSIPMFGKHYNRLTIPKVIYDMLPLEIKRELEINKVLDL